MTEVRLFIHVLLAAREKLLPVDLSPVEVRPVDAGELHLASHRHATHAAHAVPSIMIGLRLTVIGTPSASRFLDVCCMRNGGSR